MPMKSFHFFSSLTYNASLMLILPHYDDECITSIHARLLTTTTKTKTSMRIINYNNNNTQKSYHTE